MNRPDLFAAFAAALALFALPTVAAACDYIPYGTTVVVEDDTPDCLAPADTATESAPLALEVFNGCDGPVVLECPADTGCRSYPWRAVVVQPGETVTLQLAPSTGAAWTLGEMSGVVRVAFEEDPVSAKTCEGWADTPPFGCAATPGGSRGGAFGWPLALLALLGVARRRV